ncbi:TPA: hypothetical protein DCR49_03335 [Candidatus Delongbacteria bacterium]|nr:MAG: hypothetical protein A2Y39_06075 [Candidatus Delongbacteria bacterium GWF2_40_14]HAQ61020.1 hypothetical protein [Candidatus Delongbacteria bacterium]
MFVMSILIFEISLFSNNLTNDVAQNFIKTLYENGDIRQFILREEFDLSNRLGIEYVDVQNKFMIGYGIDRNFITESVFNEVISSYKIENIAHDFSILKINIPSKNYKTEYFFINENLVSRPYFYLKKENWDTLNSDYILFFSKDSARLSDYSVKKLNRFIDAMITLLKISKEQSVNLKKNKLVYILCENQEEIKRISGFDTRGIFFLGQNYLVSTYNYHVHEISHFLINYKLNKLPLFTLPVLQEGFAVAYGGRGGKQPSVLYNIGRFLLESDLIKINDILTKSGFEQFDASLSYPVSGLYVKYLVDNFGIEKFLEIYKDNSTTDLLITQLKLNITETDLYEFNKYLNTKISNKIKPVNTKGEVNYYFSAKDTIFISNKPSLTCYSSDIFNEIFKYTEYANYKYGIIPSENGVSVYNFFTNELIAFFNSSFIHKNDISSEINAKYFSIEKDVFEDDINTMHHSIFNK